MESKIFQKRLIWSLLKLVGGIVFCFKRKKDVLQGAAPLCINVWNVSRQDMVVMIAQKLNDTENHLREIAEVREFVKAGVRLDPRGQ